MAVEFVPYPSAAYAAGALQDELGRYFAHGPDYQLAGHNVEAQTGFVVMLAGGATLSAIYAKIAVDPPRRSHPGLHLMLSDESIGAPEDEPSNYDRIAPLADALALGAGRFIYPDTRTGGDRTLQRFGDGLRRATERSAIFALGVLDIGADGHTAALFNTDAVYWERRGKTDLPGTGLGLPGYDEPVEAGQQLGAARVGAAPATLLSFRRLVFLATGPDKREILTAIRDEPERYPAGKIMSVHPRAEIWSDVAPPDDR